MSYPRMSIFRWLAPAIMFAAAMAGRAQTAPQREALVSSHPTFDGQFGISVAGTPDVDGDGRGDVLVGAMHETAAGHAYAGRAYVYSGGSGLLLHELAAPAPAFGHLLGSAASGVPDTDGDGRGDLLVGEPGPAGAGYLGWAYLFSGATGALLHAVTSPNAQPGGLFGIRVSGVPDADGDGRGDLLVGASHENVEPHGSAGRAYLFSGASGTLQHSLVSPNAEVTSFFGKAVAGVDDVDGDGRGDLLVGAFQETVAGQQNAGRAYLFSGATGALLRTILSPAPGSFDYFGRSVAGVPDVDGDGRGDLLVGSLEPVVHLYSGADGSHIDALVPPTPEASPSFGNSVSGMPDLDGDGSGDLLVGAPFAQDGIGRPSPRAFVFSGATRVLLHELFSANPGAGRFGAWVSGVPDADGDGRGDVAVGAPEEDGLAPGMGRAYLFRTGTVVATAPVANTDLSLGWPSPHPVDGQASVTFELPRAGGVRLAMVDLLGREVGLLVDAVLPAGSHTTTLDVSAVPFGVYLLRLESDGGSAVRRVVVAGGR